MPPASILTVLFADISRSTALYERLGDNKALALVSAVLEMLQIQAEDCGGVLVKTMGDEIMVTFAQADRAVEAALRMHRCLEQDVRTAPLGVEIRVGLHTGEVLLQDKDVFGDAVNVAARAVALSAARQIITTAEVVEALDCDDAVRTRFLGRMSVRGRNGAVAFHEILWQPSECELTHIQSEVTADVGEQPPRLILTHQDRSYVIEAERTPFYIGRAQNNDLVVANQVVSSRHLVIEYLNGRFSARDQSTNGTFLHVFNQESMLLRREEAPLLGKGVISLGRDITSTHANTIDYRVEK